MDKANLESIYYATSLASLASNCAVILFLFVLVIDLLIIKFQLKLVAADFQATLNSGASSTNVADLYYYAFASTNLGLKRNYKFEKTFKKIILFIFLFKLNQLNWPKVL